MKALVIVDMQNDFMPGGALAVPGAFEIIPVINRLVKRFPLVVATQDWHPSNHISFAANHKGKKPGDVTLVNGLEQILWPIHCVRNTAGADFVKELDGRCFESIFYKGTDPKIDSYSAFFDNAHHKATGLGAFLLSRKVDEVYLAGVAADYCVLYSALDAVELGIKVFVITDACRGINLHPQDLERAWEAMRKKGAILISSKEI